MDPREEYPRKQQPRLTDLVCLHTLAPLALHTHDRHSHAEIELLIHRKGGEKLCNHAVNLQFHFTLHASASVLIRRGSADSFVHI